MEVTRRWLLLIIFFWAISCSLEESTNITDSTSAADLERSVRNIAKSVMQQIFPLAFRVVTESNVSVDCSLRLFQFVSDFKNLKRWALEMLDAYGKPPQALLKGTVSYLGDYDECVNIEVKGKGRRKSSFQGKYCLVKLRFSENTIRVITKLYSFNLDYQMVKDEQIEYLLRQIPLQIGICVPSTCNSEEINRMATFITKILGFSTSTTCETRVKKEPHTEQVVFLCIFALLAFMVIVGTSVDLVSQYSRMKIPSGELQSLIQAFSIYSNTVRLFSSAQDNSLKEIRSFRILSAFWIVLGHTYFLPHISQFLKYRKLLVYQEFAEQLTFKTILNASILIDTFFLLSGVTITYTVWRTLEKNKGRINPFTYFFLRIARILPVEMAVIALFMVLPLFGNGPLWNETFQEKYLNCKVNWWTNLLFIQNYWPMEEICLFHTWFIAALFQLLPLSLAIVLVIYRWPKIGISLSLLLIMIGCCVVGIMTSSHQLPSQFDYANYNWDEWRKYFEIIDCRPYTYFSSHFLGVLLGYTFVRKKNPKIKPRIQLIGWLMSTCGALTVLYSGYFFGIERNINIVYASLNRFVWSASLSWVLFACYGGFGGIIGKILSWKVFVVLDRLSLWVYLLHVLVMYYYSANIKTTIYLSHIEQVYIFLATLVITLCLSYIFCVTLEHPLKYVQSLIIRKLSKKNYPDIACPPMVLHLSKEVVSYPQIVVAPAEHVPEGNDSTKI